MLGGMGAGRVSDLWGRGAGVPRKLLSCCKYSTSRPETQGVLALVGTRIDRHREALPAKSGRHFRSEVRRTIGRDSSLHAQCVVADESYLEGEQADVSDRARIPTASSNTSALLSARRTDCAGARICLGCWGPVELPAVTGRVSRRSSQSSSSRPNRFTVFGGFFYYSTKSRQHFGTDATYEHARCSRHHSSAKA